MPKTEETWMDEKKVREAIGKLQVEINAKREMIKHNKAFFPKQDNSCSESDICVYQTAIEALEKQLPKKPEKDGVTDSRGVFHPINGIDGVPYDLCPNCYSNLCTTGMFGRDKERMKYCEKCGQRLDWSE